jgi:hypothetical protein
MSSPRTMDTPAPSRTAADATSFPTLVIGGNALVEKSTLNF